MGANETTELGGLVIFELKLETIKLSLVQSLPTQPKFPPIVSG
jgi:hypothetical protein